MTKEIKISPYQLCLLIIGLLFSDFAIMNPARSAKQDAWLAFLIGIVIGLGIISIYILIAKFNPGKNLVEILLDTFGKILGTVFSLLYVWYFIHLTSLLLRTFSEYMVNVNYDETPKYFIMICFMLTIVYGLRKGMQVVSRTTEIFMPLLIVSIIILFFMLIDNFQFDFFSPVLKNGLKPVIQTGLGIGIYPFGESIFLLMVFPYLSDKTKLAKTTYTATIISGMLLLSIVVRDLLVVGPSLISIVAFPPNMSTALLPTDVLEPLISLNLLIGGGAALSVYVHSIVLAIAQLFSIKESKTFIVPIGTIVIGVSIWLFENIPELFSFVDFYTYYSLPFQVFIPLLVLIISFMKNKVKTN